MKRVLAPLLVAAFLLINAPLAFADTYTDISATFPALESVDSMKYNGNGTWLLGGYGATAAGLYSWDGATAPTNLSGGITDMVGVDEIGWNGSYWMIGGNAATASDRLFKYDGVTPPVRIPVAVNLNRLFGIAANGGNWLIGGRSITPAEHVGMYDGSSISYLAGFAPQGWIGTIGSNGSYWLVGTDGTPLSDNLYRYDGTTITNLSSQMTDMAYILDIEWNGLYWLIAGCNNAPDREVRLFAYNGTTFTDLSAQLIAVRDMQRIRSIATNGPIWLLGGDNSSGSRYLVKYDGTTFTDLSANISGLDCIGSIATNGSTWLVGTHWGPAASSVWQVVLSPVVTAPPVALVPPEGSPILTIYGQNFGPGTTVLLRKSGQTDIPGTGVNVLNGGALTATFNLQGTAQGAWDIVVTTEGGTATLAGGLTIGYAPAELPYTGI